MNLVFSSEVDSLVNSEVTSVVIPLVNSLVCSLAEEVEEVAKFVDTE